MPRLILHPMYTAYIGFSNIYPLDRDLSGGLRNSAFERLGPGS